MSSCKYMDMILLIVQKITGDDDDDNNILGRKVRFHKEIIIGFEYKNEWSTFIVQSDP